MKEKAPTLTLFMEAGRLIRGRMDRALPLSFAQCEVLRFVGEEHEPQMRDIAGYFKISAPSATALVEECVRKGLVKRVQDARDRRQIRCTLTRKGKAMDASLSRTRRAVLARVLSSLDARDRNDLNRIMRKIVETA